MMKRRRLKALAPTLRRTRNACGDYLEDTQKALEGEPFRLAVQIEDAAVKLRALGIDSPHTGHSWTVEMVAQWFVFLSHVAPLAEIGDLAGARGMMRKELEPRTPAPVQIVKHQLDLEPLVRIGRALGASWRAMRRAGR